MDLGWQGTLREASKIRCETEPWGRSHGGWSSSLPSIVLGGVQECGKPTNPGEKLGSLNSLEKTCKAAHKLGPPSSPRNCKSPRIAGTASPRYRKSKKSSTPKQLSRNNSLSDSPCGSPIQRSNSSSKSKAKSKCTFQGAIPFFQETLGDLWSLLASFQVNSSDPESEGDPTPHPVGGDEPNSASPGFKKVPLVSASRNERKSDEKQSMHSDTADLVDLFSNFHSESLSVPSTPKMHQGSDFFFSPLGPIQKSASLGDSRYPCDDNFVLDPVDSLEALPASYLSRRMNTFESEPCLMRNDTISTFASYLCSELKSDSLFWKVPDLVSISEHPSDVEVLHDDVDLKPSKLNFDGLLEVETLDSLLPNPSFSNPSLVNPWSHAVEENSGFGIPELGGTMPFGAPSSKRLESSCWETRKEVSAMQGGFETDEDMKPVDVALINQSISQPRVRSKAANNIMALFLQNSSITIPDYH